METNTARQMYLVDEQEETIDIKRYVSLFVSNWYWFVIALILALGSAYLINRYSEKMYSVSSTLLIKDDQTSGYTSSIGNVLPGGDIFRNQQNLLNEIGILRSYNLNYKVMQELPEFNIVYKGMGKRRIVESRMYMTSPFKVLCNSISTQPYGVRVHVTILSENTYELKIEDEINREDVNYKKEMSFGERFDKYGFDFSIVRRFADEPVVDEDGSNEYWFYFVSNEQLAADYRNKLSVTPIEEDASLVTLSVTGFNAQQEADYLNTLMDVYIRYGLENKNQTADSTIKFIERQLSVILDSLDMSEEQLESFRRSHNVVDISREGSVIQTRLEKIQTEKVTYEMQLNYYNYLSDYLRQKYADGTILSPSVMGINDQVLIRLVTELSDIQKEISRVGFNLSGDQPAFELLEKQLETTRKALMENVSNGIRNIKIAINETDRRIKAVEGELKGLPATERQLITIERNYNLNNTVYTYLLEKRSESEIAKASNVSDNRIIDRASYYSTVKIKPKDRQNWLIAFLLGIIVPAVVLVIISFMNDTIIDKKDIEKKTKVPVIGVIGHSESQSFLPVVDKPGSSLAESFRSIRTVIKYFVQEDKPAVMAITSTVTSEGKSFISSNLAAIMAMLGKRVLVVGLDLRKPQIGHIFKYSDSEGMSTYLSNNSEYETLIKPASIDNLFFAPAGSIPPNPSELIESPRMKEFMERVKKEFDYVVIDTPPIGIVTDTLLLAPYVDLTLFIVRQRYTSRDMLDLVEQYHARGTMKNLAIVLNDIKIKGYYGYGMRYVYGYGYNYGYNYYGKGYYSRYGYRSKNDKNYYSE